jgi:hypothetical protein
MCCHDAAHVIVGLMLLNAPSVMTAMFDSAKV